MVRCINCGNYFYKWELITWGGSPRCPLCCDTGDFEEYKEEDNDGKTTEKE